MARADLARLGVVTRPRGRRPLACHHEAGYAIVRRKLGFAMVPGPPREPHPNWLALIAAEPEGGPVRLRVPQPERSA